MDNRAALDSTVVIFVLISAGVILVGVFVVAFVFSAAVAGIATAVSAIWKRLWQR